MDSLEQAFNAQPALEDAPLGASKEALVLPKGGIPTGGSPDAKGAVAEAPLEVVVVLSFLSKLASVSPHRPRMPD